MSDLTYDHVPFKLGMKVYKVETDYGDYTHSIRTIETTEHENFTKVKNGVVLAHGKLDKKDRWTPYFTVNSVFGSLKEAKKRQIEILKGRIEDLQDEIKNIEQEILK